ncbi:MAG: hypothetical protein ACE5IO_03700, partial [Thermoplasmata archaeon]
AMTKLDNSEKRGRPDITHLSLLSLLETPLCKAGLLTVNLHLQDGRMINVNPKVRLPRNYDRFVGLVEQLIQQGRVPPEGEPLLMVTSLTLQELVSKLKGPSDSTISILCTEGGARTTIDDLHSVLPTDASIPLIVGIGAFPHGDLPQDIKTMFESHVELDIDTMMAWHVCAEVLWTYSWRIDVTRRRFED